MTLFDASLHDANCAFELPGLLSSCSADLDAPPRKKARLSHWCSVSNDNEALHEWAHSHAFKVDDDLSFIESAPLQPFDSLCALDYCASSITPQRPRVMAMHADYEDEKDVAFFNHEDIQEEKEDEADETNSLRRRFLQLAEQHSLTPLAPRESQVFPTKQHLQSILSSFRQHTGK